MPFQGKHTSRAVAQCFLWDILDESSIVDSHRIVDPFCQSIFLAVIISIQSNLLELQIVVCSLSGHFVCFVLFCSFFSTLLYFFLCPPLLCSTLLHSSILFSYFSGLPALLFSTFPYFTLLYSSPLSALLSSTKSTCEPHFRIKAFAPVSTSCGVMFSLVFPFALLQSFSMRHGLRRVAFPRWFCFALIQANKLAHRRQRKRIAFFLWGTERYRENVQGVTHRKQKISPNSYLDAAIRLP